MEPGGPLRIGGVDVPHDRQLVGHSDADVLLHAATDALLGAAGLEDIGRLFPDSAPENRHRDSADMLRAAREKITAAGYGIVNLQCVVHAQRPLLAPHQESMQKRIADILTVPLDRISLQAKTGEGVGPVGREEAICVRCVTLLQKMSERSS